jgi:hypothetical protein
MKPSVLLAVVALATAIDPARAYEIEPSPLSVVQALMDAERETDLELALSLFSKDAIIVNVVGDKILSAQLPRFLELDMWRIYGNPCSAFIQWMKAESALAIAGTATSGSARDPVEMRVE